ncbi:NB-ARC domain-containing protein, partial [Acinetobacter baumannii]|nr:NB-ARC domain-containing protein [Acinetobacter baumannii]
MSYRNYTTRMSCFALIAAIESDFRLIIYFETSDKKIESVLPEDVLSNAKHRFRSDKPSENHEEVSLSDLLEYVDFYDLSKILNKVKNEQKFFTIEQLTVVTRNLENLTAARNRVCHSRPLEADDFTSLFDFSCELESINKSDNNWRNLKYAKQNLNNADFILTNTIPDFWKNEKNHILQNLPLTEFDDTSFLGRKDDRKKITDLILSNTRVITIIGEGGIGKTAIAQRCLYDILEICENQKEEQRSFDMILWVSLKTNRLTQAGAISIKDAITNSSDMFKIIHDNFANSSDMTIDDVLKEILEYMDTFKILLCIDNLETISSASVRNFLSQIPNKSKVLITTRMGLGEIEYRYKLDKLNDKDSIDLLRTMAKILNLTSIVKKKADTLKTLSSQLFNNPLLIKWYVLNEASGNNMREFFNKNSSSFKEALKFCFENLYDNLSDFELKTISTIACLKKPVSNVELKYYLDDLDEIQLQQALNQLFNSSMLVSSSVEDSNKLYSLTGIAEEYIVSLRPVDKSFYILIKEKQKKLQNLVESERKEKNHYKYDLSVIHSNNKDEAICALYLKQALAAFRDKEFDYAGTLIEKAKVIMPDYSEIYRVNGYLLKDINPFQAETEFETGIEINERDPLIRYAYAQFFLEQGDSSNALEQIEAALKLDPKEIALINYKAWALTMSGKYIEAITIYEKLLEDPYNLSPHKKFRASTFDQAIGCYRRYAERLMYDNDWDSVEEQILNALVLANKAIYTNNID